MDYIPKDIEKDSDGVLMFDGTPPSHQLKKNLEFKEQLICNPTSFPSSTFTDSFADSSNAISTLKSHFQTQRDYINYFFDHLDYYQTEKALELMLACQGTIIFVGVGKSGIIGKKLAASFISLGIKSSSMDSTEALHGDIGVVCEDDLLVLISKSGESDELIRLVPFAKSRNACLIALVSNPDSRLAHLCHFSVTLPLKDELCPFSLAPLTSPAIQLIFGDTLAVEIMKRRQLSLEDYAKNHPGGRIGKRLQLRIKDIMQTIRMPFCSPGAKIWHVLTAMTEGKCGCVLVVEEELQAEPLDELDRSKHHKERTNWNHPQLKGIFTDGDLRRLFSKEGILPGDLLELPVSKVMNKHPVTVQAEASAWNTFLSVKGKCSAIPVIDDNGVVLGIVSNQDFVMNGLL